MHRFLRDGTEDLDPGPQAADGIVQVQRFARSALPGRASGQSRRSQRAGPDALTSDLEACGLLFESLVVRDLRVYAETNECDVYHHRLDNGLEADAIVRRRYTGEWIAVEAKLSHGPDAVDAAARSLLRVAEAVDTSRAGPLAALLVVTPAGYSYTRPDGGAVVPITALGP